MKSSKERIEREVYNLVEQGYQILVNESSAKHQIVVEDKKIEKQKNPANFQVSYNQWYSKTLPLIRQVLPDRLTDFIDFYKPNKLRKEISFLTYTISDYLIGLSITEGGRASFDANNAFTIKYLNQLSILQNCAENIDSITANITEVLQAQLFDSEIEVAKELINKKHVRAAGAIAGVVLEKHLEQIMLNHLIKSNKKNLHLSDYLELLKNNNVIDIPQWRFLLRLADIRNYCAHSKEREPTNDEVKELVEGVDKTVKTLH